MSFQLVDRIQGFVPGRRAQGTLQIPAPGEDFPVSLVVEAVGQLAAWVAMHDVDFARRPVAAIAGEVLVLRGIRPGDRLDLEVELGAVRPSAIRYGGLARVGGEVAVELRRCTGAMLPMEEFDDPSRVEREFRSLCDAGAPARSFPDRAEFAPMTTEHEVDAAGRLHATLTAPSSAPFYADHFPLRPVYPATLLLEAKIAVAQRLAELRQAEDGPRPRLHAVRSVKVRAFTPPGGRVEVVVEAAQPKPADRGLEIHMAAFSDGARVSSATAHFAADEPALSGSPAGAAPPPEPDVRSRRPRPRR